MLAARTSFGFASLPSLLRKLAMYAAVELLGQASVSLTLETARSRNLAVSIILFIFKTRHLLIPQTVGKFRV